MCNTTKKNYSVQATTIPTSLKSLNTKLPIAPVELHKTKQLPLDGKEYLWNQINSKSTHAAQCVKSQILNKAIDSILSIETPKQQCVVIKCILQSSRLEDHMKTIGIEQQLFKFSSSEHKCMNNIKYIYQHAGKCDDQQNLQDILDAAMILTLEGFTNNSLDVPMTSTPVNKPSARK